MTKLTPKRLEWLKHLKAEGPAKRESGINVGYACMQAGWTQWAYWDGKTGEKLTFEEARGQLAADKNKAISVIVREEITPLGLAKIEESERGEP